MARTDQEIVDQTNDLARIALRYIGTGYEAPEGFKFYAVARPDPAPPAKPKKAKDWTGLSITPGMVDQKLYARASKAWDLACEIQMLMTDTDPNDALSAIEDDQHVVFAGLDAALAEVAKPL